MSMKNRSFILLFFSGPGTYLEVIMENKEKDEIAENAVFKSGTTR